MTATTNTFDQLVDDSERLLRDAIAVQRRAFALVDAVLAAAHAGRPPAPALQRLAHVAAAAATAVDGHQASQFALDAVAWLANERRRTAGQTNGTARRNVQPSNHKRPANRPQR